MSFKFFHFLFLQCVIFHNYFNFSNAMIGRNVRTANRNEFRFVLSMVTLVDTDHIEEAHRCTAALITRQDVLTAEHCVRDMAVDGFVLMMGSINLREATAYFAAWWVSYDIWANDRPGHRRFRVNDMAIIKVNKNVERNIPFAPLLNRTLGDLTGLEVSMAGWGRAANGSNTKKLRTAKVTVLDRLVCQNRARQLGDANYVIHERRICTAADPYVLVRSGDSGGPLIYSGGIIGVTYGSGPTLENDIIHPSQVNFHFSTYFYRDFLFDVMTNSHINYE